MYDKVKLTTTFTFPVYCKEIIETNSLSPQYRSNQQTKMSSKLTMATPMKKKSTSMAPPPPATPRAKFPDSTVEQTIQFFFGFWINLTYPGAAT